MTPGSLLSLVAASFKLAEAYLHWRSVQKLLRAQKHVQELAKELAVNELGSSPTKRDGKD